MQTPLPSISVHALPSFWFSNYSPFAFDEVLFPPEDLEIPRGTVGSAPRLLAELDRLAAVLAIPDSLTAEWEELWEASDAPLPDGDTWQRYGRESSGA